MAVVSDAAAKAEPAPPPYAPRRKPPHYEASRPMPRFFRKSLLWALGFATVTALLFDTFSYGVAHANPILLAVFFGAGFAGARDFPGIDLPGGIFVYQLAYYLAWAVIVSAIVGIVRVRKKRLFAEGAGHDAR